MFEKLKSLPIWEIAMIVCLTGLSIWSQGYHYGLAAPDHFLWLPIMNFFNDPASFPQDVFVASANDAYLPFWRIMAYGAKIIPPEFLFFLVHVSIRFIILLFLWLIAKRLCKSNLAALISLSLLIHSKVYLASFQLHSGTLTHTTAAWLMLIISLYFFFKDNFLFAYVFLGMGFNFNPPLGAQLFILFGIYLLTKKEIWFSKQLYLGLFFCFLLFFPVAKHVLMSNAPVDKNLAIELIRLRLSHHIFPFSWSLKSWVSFFNVVLLLVLSLKVEADPDVRKKVFSFLGGMVVISGIGALLTEFYPSLLILQFLPLRSHRFIVFLSFLLAGGYFKQYLDHESTIPLWLKGIVIISWLLFLIYSGPVWLISLCLFVLLSIQVFYLYPGFSWSRGLVLALGMITLTLVTADKLFFAKIAIEKRIFTLSNWALIIIIILGLSTYYYLREKHSERPLLAILAILVTLCFSSVFHLSYQSRKDPRPDIAFESLQTWARLNTPKDSLFITPPYLYGFRVFSDRSSFFDWKDLCSVAYSPQLAIYWKKILGEYGVKGKLDNANHVMARLKMAFNGFDEKRFMELGRKYNIRYVITYKPQRLALKMVYRNPLFNVYQLPKS